jgi:SAM-dependent methyltransferase
MSKLKPLYHRFVPAAVRFPIGRMRRTLMDIGLRLSRRHGALPPRRVLKKVQMTPWAMEYLEVGARCANTVRRELEAAGLPAGKPHRVLDFGCGLARTLRHLRDTSWYLAGCDVDAASIEWSRRAVPGIPLEVNGDDPPMPYDDDAFDAVYAISVFTHFPTARQGPWAAELSRILRPGGLALVTTMGPWAFAALPEGAEEPLPGFWFHGAGTAFNDSAAIHTREGLEHFFSPHFETVSWTRGGLDGFQDLALFRKR